MTLAHLLALVQKERKSASFTVAAKSSAPAQYELHGRLSNVGTHLASIRVPNISASTERYNSGKLFYGLGTDTWSDICWRLESDAQNFFQHLTFTEIVHRTVKFKLFDLYAHSHHAGEDETFFRGRVYILKPSTVPCTHLAQQFLRNHRIGTEPVNDGAYDFSGCLDKQL